MSPPPLEIPRVGSVQDKPTALDKWAFSLLCWTGITVLLFCLYGVYDLHQIIEPKLPDMKGSTVAEVQAAVNQHKLISEELRAPFLSTFDLIVTRTLMPFVTLLTGYLFGKSKH